MKKFLTITFSVACCFLFLVSGSFAQQLVTTVNADSTVIITQDPRLEELIRKQKQNNIEKPTIQGFRVQIYFGGNRQKAAEVKLDFANRFTEIPAYMTYQQPNFKVRVGNFRTRFEAQKLLKSIERKYPTTFVVADEINLPVLK